MAIETLSVGNNSNVIYVAPSNSTNKEIADYVCLRRNKWFKSD